MIPIQLTIQGLYSYQEKQTIDFTQLTSAKLFGIFGSVGSGKSSILEAITFAIYGRTDRLNLSGDNRNYNMMNLKSHELLIDFIFETGKEQTAYRVTVKGRRNSKKFEDVKALDRAAYQKVNGEWLPIAADSMDEVIGLSYDNFKRTIIIPQGQFQEFLQLGNKDRTQMMKELFNLGKYDFYYKVAALESENNGQRQNTEGQLQQLGAVDPELLKGYGTRLEELKKELEEQNKKLEAQQKEEEQYRQLQALTLKLAEAGKAFQALQAQVPAVREMEKKMLRFEQCVHQFKHLLEAVKSARSKLTEREQQIDKDALQLKKEEAAIAQLDKALAELKPAYDKREELKQRAAEMDLLLRIKALEKEVATEAERLKKGAEVCAQTTQKLEDLKKDQSKQETLLKTLRQKQPDWSLLSNVKTWHSEKKQLDEQLKEMDKDGEKCQQDVMAGQKALLEVLKDPLLNQLPSESDHAACLQCLQERTGTLKDKIKQLDEQGNHLRVKAQLKDYADQLENGAPCPLCGSEHHPELFNAADFKEAQAQLTKERGLMEAEQEKISALREQLNTLHQQREFTMQRQKELEARKSAQLKRIETHAGLFVWDKYRDANELTKAFQEAELLKADIEKQQAAQELMNQQVGQAEKNKERYQGEVEKIRNALTVHQTELKTIAGQLKLVDAALYKETGVAVIEVEQARLLAEYQRIEKAYTEQSAQLQERNKAKDTLMGTLTVNRRELEQEKKALEKLQNQIDEQLEKSAFFSIDEVLQVLAEPLDVEAEKKKLARFNEQLLQQQSLYNQLQKEMGSQVYDAAKHQQLTRDMVSLKAQLPQKNQEVGKISEMLKKLQKDLARQAELKKVLDALNLRAENIKTMKGLFKGSGFVNYISSVYLQNLCNAANDRFFQLTRQKLSLEITPDNSFQVRDYMNGGKVRSVKTLSGGQTFQAALSLALALADNIQKITQSNQNFFFLDEGFGSLDKDSLSVVFDTLKSLRQENRIVGVISHVEEMQQEIDVHLRIENDEEKGSIVVASWRR
ncbi:AAA family ATPase [Geofilum rubicundum]|uniref:Exonuclease SbcC n=1 Tax=Geofilum rubicundum JCM 15548 TaxID=1236989 RepID=A0A0E9LXJ3_9BACT|nr:SMC family ATPase [Geofilum rubicundum]GAO29959.1 exonuclease SbcC [Geofilum rubicundum JCM 15548]